MRLKLDGVHTTEVDGQTVILDALTSRYLTTNAQGTLLVEALKSHQTLADLASLLVEAYGIGDEHALADCQLFVDKLRDLDLMVE